MRALLPTLDARTRNADQLDAVRKKDLLSGDSVLVRTRNSVYAIRVLGDGFYEVSGGWFESHGGVAQVVTINGCTWGGSAIKHDIVAARGLFLEFGNRVVTTRIRDVLVVRAESSDQPTDSWTRTGIPGAALPPDHHLN